MEEFPSDIELTAASALLILSNKGLFSTTTTSIFNMEEEFERRLCKKSDVEFSSLEISTGTTPCPSSLTSDDSVQAHRLKLMADAAYRFHETNLKVVRRARSKVIYRNSGDSTPAPTYRKNPPAMKSGIPVILGGTTTTTTAEGSCLSSGGSSEISSGRSRNSRRPPPESERKRRTTVEMKAEERKRGVGSNHIRRRAEAILRMLSAGGRASEVRIRQALGDSPDTSKALRMLLKMEEVKRTGAGGRSDPFIYMIAA